MGDKWWESLQIRICIRNIWQENRNMYCVVFVEWCLSITLVVNLFIWFTLSSSFFGYASLFVCVSLSLRLSLYIYMSVPLCYLFSLFLLLIFILIFASFSMAFFEQQTFDQRRVGRSFSTNVSKNNQCPKCNLVIFKTEELVAAGAAWHKKCFTVSNGFCSQTILSYLF